MFGITTAFREHGDGYCQKLNEKHESDLKPETNIQQPTRNIQ